MPSSHACPPVPDANLLRSGKRRVTGCTVARDEEHPGCWQRCASASTETGVESARTSRKERYAMSRDTTVIPFRQPDAIDDPLSELAREGARRMLAQVLVAEADAFVAMWKDLKLPDGRDRVVRHGHGPRRAIQTGFGPVEVRRAKVRDRGAVGAEEKIRFTPGRVVRRTFQRQVGDRKSGDYCMTIVPNAAGNP